jgi:hypothetical protein
MQKLGVRVYSQGARASTAMASSTWDSMEADKHRVRFRRCAGAAWSRERAEGEIGGAIATSTLTGGGLSDDHELHNGGFSSADRRRAPGEVREMERDKWRHRGEREIQRGFYTALVSLDHGGLERKRLG